MSGFFFTAELFLEKSAILKMLNERLYIYKNINIKD